MDTFQVKPEYSLMRKPSQKVSRWRWRVLESASAFQLIQQENRRTRVFDLLAIVLFQARRTPPSDITTSTNGKRTGASAWPANQRTRPYLSPFNFLSQLSTLNSQLPLAICLSP